VLALDGVEDPQNLGALLRVADGAGVDGVVLTERRSAPISPVTVKASAAGAYANTATITDTGTPPDPNTGNNSYTAVATVQTAACATVSQAAPGGTLTGTVNTYYPGTASVTAAVFGMRSSGALSSGTCTVAKILPALSRTTTFDAPLGAYIMSHTPCAYDCTESSPTSGAEAPADAQGGFTISRALAKTITYRTVATVVDFTTNFVVVGDLVTAAGLSASGFILGPFVYWGHEKAWDRYGTPGEHLPEVVPPVELLPAKLLPAPG